MTVPKSSQLQCTYYVSLNFGPLVLHTIHNEFEERHFAVVYAVILSLKTTKKKRVSQGRLQNS